MGEGRPWIRWIWGPANPNSATCRSCDLGQVTAELSGFELLPLKKGPENWHRGVRGWLFSLREKMENAGCTAGT